MQRRNATLQSAIRAPSECVVSLEHKSASAETTTSFWLRRLCNWGQPCKHCWRAGLATQRTTQSEFHCRPQAACALELEPTLGSQSTLLPTVSCVAASFCNAKVLLAAALRSAQTHRQRTRGLSPPADCDTAGTPNLSAPLACPLQRHRRWPESTAHHCHSEALLQPACPCQLAHAHGTTPAAAATSNVAGTHKRRPLCIAIGAGVAPQRESRRRKYPIAVLNAATSTEATRLSGRGANRVSPERSKSVTVAWSASYERRCERRVCGRRAPSGLRTHTRLFSTFHPPEP